MDPRDRADAALNRASAHNRWVVTPLNATSPMDAKPTVQIPRVVVDAADQQRREQDPDTTVQIPGSVAAGKVPVPPQQQQTQQFAAQQPTQQFAQQQPTQQMPQGGQPTQQLPQPQQATQQLPAAQPDEETKQLPGIIPTTQQGTGRRISLTDRLSGALPESDQS